ncbi:uncharacterized protein N7482_006670 [Penicillium canariense]|uniref:Uncharacterized protein n=1 Tax=Penicillium canariense TaxID=189055 RepID=A0A9W9HY07_9EURO|nr:uncharacterized protein N7482_006670 [Penicillium canariense]KAJ5159666.1 hypothetical protein N7482_006670 [Penicillium canariense]
MEVGAATFMSDQPGISGAGAQKPKKKRIRNWTVEDQTVNCEFEQSRREAFSKRLMGSCLITLSSTWC